MEKKRDRMSNALAIQTNESKWTPEQTQLLKNTVCKGATDDEFKIFCYAVQRTGLDPFMKQIHAVKRWNAKANREDMSIQTGIDGFRLIAHRTGSYAGIDAIVFDNDNQPKKATATVYRIVQGVRCGFTASARWAEYYPGDKQGFMWKKMPCVMLGKVAESIALRMAFPAELSGLYSNEEMQQADREVQEVKSEIVTHTPVAAPNPELVAKREEAGKINQLRTELGLSREDVEKTYKKSLGAMTVDELKTVVKDLQDEKILRDKPVETPAEPAPQTNIPFDPKIEDPETFSEWT